MKKLFGALLIAALMGSPLTAMAMITEDGLYRIDPSVAGQEQCAQYGAVWDSDRTVKMCKFDEDACRAVNGSWVVVDPYTGSSGMTLAFCDTATYCNNITAAYVAENSNLLPAGTTVRFDTNTNRCVLDNVIQVVDGNNNSMVFVEGFTNSDANCSGYGGTSYVYHSTLGSSAYDAYILKSESKLCMVRGVLNTNSGSGSEPTGSSSTTCPNLMTTIGASEAATGYGSLSLDGELTRNTDTYGIANTGEFVVDYGNKGKIHGYASCSTRSATDPWVDQDGQFGGAYVLQSDSLTETLPNSSGQYCYCQLDGYTANGSPTTVALSTPWVFAADENSGEDCEYMCAEECTDLLRYDRSGALSYRTAVFNSVTCESSTPASSNFRVSGLTFDEADGTIIASGAYAKGAYNANVGNINTALTYVEDSSVETIKHATVSAGNVSLSVAGFTPVGTIDVDSSNATVSGTVNVANTVAMLSQWGTNSTANGTLSGSQQVSITNGSVTGMTGSFSGPANGQLSGTGTLSNASIHVNNWVPVNPS